jgi:hypothetical protein
MQMLSLSLVALALQAARPMPEPPRALDLLEGEWVCRAEWMAGGPVWRSESWHHEDDGRLTGTIRTGLRRAGSGEMAITAELVISGRGRSLRLTYRPAGGAPVRYRLVRETQQEAVFESTGNGSPRIITYRDSGFRRLDVMHALTNGSSRRWSYQPQGMHTPAIDCDGRR